MANYNRIVMVGRMTRDPDLRTTPAGASVCDFGLAVNRKYRDKSGTDHEEVCFIDVVAWGKAAEVIAEYMEKGREILIEGRLCLEQWEKDGQKRSKHKITCENFQFIGGRDQAAGESATAPAADAEPEKEPVPYDDSTVPF